MTNTVLIKRSSVANAVPQAGNLQAGELAINYNDGSLFYKNASNVVTVIASNQFASVSGNVTGGNIVTSGIVTATGNITGNYFIGNGAFLTGITAVSSYGNANVADYLASGTDSSNIVTSANVTGGNITTSGLITAAGNVTGNYFIGNGSQLTGISASSMDANNLTGNTLSSNVIYSSLTSVGVLSNLTVSGNVTAGYGANGELLALGNASNSNDRWITIQNLAGPMYLGTSNTTAYINSNADRPLKFYTNSTEYLSIANTGQVSVLSTTDSTSKTTGALIVAGGGGFNGNVYANYFAGNGSLLTNIAGANVTGTVANATYADSAGTAVTVTANAQPNITSVGTLTSVSVSGNALTGGLISAAGNVTGNYFIGNGSQLTGITASNVGTLSTLSVTGNTTTGNLLTGGLISATGNLTANAGLFNNGLSVVGNITATGNLNYQNVTDLVVGDPLIYLAANNTSDLVDIGFVGSANVSGVYQHLGFVRDHTDAKWKLFANVVAEPTTVIDWANAVYQTLVAGNVSSTGTVVSTGNITGGNLLTGGLVSATGNLTAGNVLTSGLISATSTITSTANITGGNILTGGLVSATSNIVGGNLTTAGLITATGNLTAGNILTAGLVSATGNLTAGNILTAGLVSATGNVTGAYFIGNGSQLTGISTSTSKIFNGTSEANIGTSGGNANITIGGTSNVAVFTTGGLNITGNISATANITGGNLLTGGLVSATGNLTAGNILTAGLISATSTITSAANITGGNLLTGGLISATGNVTGGNITTGGTITAIGNIIGGNISTPGSGGNITGANVISGTTLSATANVVAGNVTTAGLISATGNVTGNYFIGNGSLLTGISASTSKIYNGTSEANIGTANGNANISIAGTSNVAVFTSGGLNITGTVSATANVTGGNLLTGGLISAASTVTAAGVTSTGVVNLTGASNVSLGSVTNLHITGGSANYVLSTDGAGGLSWVAQSGGSATGNVDAVIDNFTGNGVATSFTLSTTPSSANIVLVNYNGALVSHNSYSVVGNVLTFGSAPANTASIEVSTFTGGGGGGGGGASNVSIRAQAMTMSILLGG